MAAYLKSLDKWRAWRESRKTKRAIPAAQVPFVAELADKFLSTKQTENGLANREYLTKHLSRFLHHYGDQRADVLRPKHLHALKQSMLRKPCAPKTVNHDLVAVRGLFKWGGNLPHDSRSHSHFACARSRRQQQANERLNVIHVNDAATINVRGTNLPRITAPTTVP